MSAELIPVAERILGQTIDSLEQSSNGGNSRLYRVVAGGREFALKLYPEPGSDSRDRIGVEGKTLRLFEAQGVKNVPRWFGAEGNAAIMEWIEGELVREPTPEAIDAAVAFMGAMKTLSAQCSDEFPLASEACLSGAEILRQIERRLKRLDEVATDEPMLAEFLAKRFRPVLAANAQPLSTQELPQEKRCLIPADFGFHNTLQHEGRYIFIDFEYFGWDDPVKLISDFLLHPAMNLPADLQARFKGGMLAHFAADDGFQARFSAHYPLFGLRWALILLNEFLPERWQIRASARGESDWHEVKQRQLGRAELMLTRSSEMI